MTLRTYDMSERDDNIEQALHVPVIPTMASEPVASDPMIDDVQPGDVLPDDFHIPTLEEMIEEQKANEAAAAHQDVPTDEQPGMGFGVACQRPNCLFVGTGRSLELATIALSEHTSEMHPRTMPDNIDVAPIMSTVPLSEAPPFDPDAPDEPHVGPEAPIEI